MGLCVFDYIMSDSEPNYTPPDVLDIDVRVQKSVLFCTLTAGRKETYDILANDNCKWNHLTEKFNNIHAVSEHFRSDSFIKFLGQMEQEIFNISTGLPSNEENLVKLTILNSSTSGVKGCSDNLGIGFAQVKSLVTEMKAIVGNNPPKRSEVTEVLKPPSITTVAQTEDPKIIPKLRINATIWGKQDTEGK